MKPKAIVVVSDEEDLFTGEGMGEGEVSGWDIEVMDQERFLAGEGAASTPGLAVVNLCRDWSYLSRGYYVSLLADARGQRCTPSVDALEAMASSPVRNRALQEAGVQVLTQAEVARRIETLGESFDPELRSLGVPPVLEWDREDRPVLRPPRAEEHAQVLVCLGEAMDPRFRDISDRVYRAWPAPVLRLSLLREAGHWWLYYFDSVPVHKLSPEERAHLLSTLRRPRIPRDNRARRRVPSLAVLFDKNDAFKPSGPKTIQHLARVAARRGLRLEVLGLQEIERLAEHDALFIRTLTGPDLPSFLFASRAEALRIPVIDDPGSILRCANKVFLHERMQRAELATPKTVIISPESSFEELSTNLGLPYVVKLPDGSFSAAVHKIISAEDHERLVRPLLKRSPLLVAQEYLPTDFDWRVTVLGGRPLFACRYHMSPGHWQIRNETDSGVRYGKVEAVPRAEAPQAVLQLACAASRLVGEGLYGVDLKEGPKGPVLIEVNDNPNIDIGFDDKAEGEVLFEDLVDWFSHRIARSPVEWSAARAERPSELLSAR